MSRKLPRRGDPPPLGGFLGVLGLLASMPLLAMGVVLTSWVAPRLGAFPRLKTAIEVGVLVVVVLPVSLLMGKTPSVLQAPSGSKPHPQHGG